VALVAAWVLLGVAYVVHSPWLAYLSTICLVTSCFLRVTSRWDVPYLWGVWLLLWLVVQVPLNRDHRLIGILQQQSSQLSSTVLDWVGVAHLMEGNTLILPDKQFFVDEACSGIVSVMSIIACAMIYGVWRNRPPVHLAVLALAGVGWATLMNVVRISVIAMAYQWYGVDWSKGTPHEMLGLAIFLCTFLALVSTDFLLVVLLAPVQEAYIQQFGDPMQVGAWLVRVWDWLQGWGRPVAYAMVSGGEREARIEEEGVIKRMDVPGFRWRGMGELQKSRDGIQGHGHSDEGLGANREGALGLSRRFVLGTIPMALFTVLAGAQFAVPVTAPPLAAGLPRNLDRALAMDAGTLPASMGGAERTSFSTHERDRDDVFGNYSQIYEYRDERGNTYMVSCDFAFDGWHELTQCYMGVGWKINRREVNTEAGQIKELESAWGYANADYTKPDGSAAYLAFCLFDEYGTRMSPASNHRWWEIWRSLQYRFYAVPEKTYQVQVWTTAPGKVDENQKKMARELLLEARERFRTWMVGDATSPAKGMMNGKAAG
jgi:exosortase